MEQTFPGATEYLKRQSYFSRQNVPNGTEFVFYFFKAIFDTCRFRFCGRFSVDATDLFEINGKRDFRKIFATPKFGLLFAQTMHRPVWHVNGKQL